MFDELTLTHAEQQVAVERIHALMAQGISSGQAIAMVANELREQAQQNTDRKKAD
ncbi:hypothetical protein VST7929_03011 [Vibrio stylophorae]|uniref:Uncharacterized protein n=1 Tax=Vibrio stylophorae TaxID=659351 RepID=A0ABM8ZXI4_9VIBR|nr:YoaH family protein [Vibrio stylophorae]CAH0535437.1 hypothetical protein VST7929_03011 [Vibrio stylophorae]